MISYLSYCKHGYREDIKLSSFTVCLMEGIGYFRYFISIENQQQPLLLHDCFLWFFFLRCFFYDARTSFAIRSEWCWCKATQSVLHCYLYIAKWTLFLYTLSWFCLKCIAYTAQSTKYTHTWVPWCLIEMCSPWKRRVLNSFCRWVHACVHCDMCAMCEVLHLMSEEHWSWCVEGQ